ncbi:MAG: hypothetical protein H6948_05190 [Zoogloeaceae bacterium]|nr:hypothetical protein [Zoogloeaceae bacterium]
MLFDWSSTSTEATVGLAIVLALIGTTKSWPVSTQVTVTVPVAVSSAVVPVYEIQTRAVSVS